MSDQHRNVSDTGLVGDDRRRQERTAPRRALTITLLVSVGLHLAAATAVLLLLHAGVPAVDVPEKPAEVELVMEEHKGDANPTAPVAGAQTEKSPPQEQQQAASPPSPPAKEPVQAQPEADRRTDAPAVASMPAPPATTAQKVSPETRPKPAEAPPAVTITLNGTDSPSDARAWGNRILPAAPDALFHNRPPEYPAEAARNGQHGTVVLLVHVAPSGRAAGVDVVASSGYALLDRAAGDAVARWRFLPAVKDGQPVASEMTMGFIFDY